MEAEKKKRSFWQVLTNQKAEVEVKFYDPLKIRIDSLISLNHPDFAGRDFRLARIMEYTRHIGDQTFVTTFYELEEPGQRAEIRLAANPIKGARKEDAYPYTLTLFRKTYEQGWTEDIEAVLDEACTNGIWVDEDDGQDDDGNQVREPIRNEYVRCHDLRSYYDAEVGIVEDEDSDGKFEETEIRRTTVRYLDFEREVVVGNSDTLRDFEYFMVEKNSEDGWITMWIGNDVDPGKIDNL